MKHLRSVLAVNARNLANSQIGDSPANPGGLATDLSPSLNPLAIHHAMRKVADWQDARIPNPPHQDWTFATLYLGMLAASKSLGDPRYHDHVQTIAKQLRWQLGPNKENADDQAIGQSYLWLYQEKPSEEKLQSLKSQFDELLKSPDDPGKPVWWWCDALFMAPPVWTELSEATHDDKYLTYMDRQWHITSDLLWDPREKLISRDKSYLDKHEANGRKLFWSRGNGWVMAGLAQVLEHLPPQDPRRTYYETKLKEMAESIAAIQGKDGLWRPGLLDADAYPEPEISGSAFFTYAIAWGIRNGVLPATRFRPIVEKAWAGMLRHIYADGRLGDIQPIGDAPGAYSPGSSYVYGVGAFLLAGSEVDALSTPK